MSELLGRTLLRLTHIPGVRGAMVVDTEAGVPVASDLSPGVDETALAAMADSLYSRTAEASQAAGTGAVTVVQLEAASGHVVVADAGPLLVVAVTDGAAQLGLVRVEARRAAEELSR